MLNIENQSTFKFSKKTFVNSVSNHQFWRIGANKACDWSAVIRTSLSLVNSAKTFNPIFTRCQQNIMQSSPNHAVIHTPASNDIDN